MCETNTVIPGALCPGTQGSTCLLPRLGLLSLPPCHPTGNSKELQHCAPQGPCPARTPEGKRVARVAQGYRGPPRLPCLLLGPLPEQPPSAGPSSAPAQPKKGEAGGCWWAPHPTPPHTTGPSPTRTQQEMLSKAISSGLPTPASSQIPSEHSPAVPAAPATASCQTAAYRAVSSSKPKRLPSQSSSAMLLPTQGPADALGAGRV